MSGYFSELLAGVAVRIAERTPAVWRPDGPVYGAGEIGIVLGELPTGPAAAVALAVYDDAEAPSGGAGSTYNPAVEVALTYLQVRWRFADYGDAMDFGWAVRSALHKKPYTIPALGRVIGYAVSMGPLGRDDNNRWMFSLNLQFRARRERT